MKQYFRIKSSDNYNNLILELVSDVDLYTINQVINHQYTGIDLPEYIYFIVKYIGYQENPDYWIKGATLPFSAVTKSRSKDFAILPMKNVSHLPSDINEWIDYTSCKLRYKMQYNIELLDGTKVYGCYPNGNSFTVLSSERNQDLKRFDFNDNEIAKIQLCNKGESNFLNNTDYSIENNFKIFRYFLLNEKAN